jgi:C1A family cysteine protease
MAITEKGDHRMNVKGVTAFCIFIIVTIILGTAGINPALARGLSKQDIEVLKQRAEEEGWSFIIEENEATQYDLEELCGLVVPDKWWEGARFVPCTPTKSLPSRFDWRDSSGTTPIRNQGGCGSCWAFATVGPLECNIKIKDGITTNLSEQWLVSCNSEGWGCNGGWFAHDYHQWKTDPCGGTGAVMEADFPYTASDDPCDCPYPHEYFIDDWAFVGNGSSIPPVDNIKQAIMDYGPVSVAVCANSAMQAYGGGIFDGCENGTINHAVVLVGWDDDQGTDGVWFMRNSWGGTWGELGYMRMPYDCSYIGYAACFVEYAGSVLQVNLPDGTPEVVAPGETTTITVQIEENSDSYVPGSGTLHYRYDGGTYLTSPLVHVSGDLYEATLPAAACSDEPEYYFSAEGTQAGVVYNPSDAPSTIYSSLVGELAVYFSDDFETDQGWTVSAGASTGNWERADPQEVSSSGTITQPEDDHSTSGTMCYVTGPLAGSGAGSYDVDGGPTRLTSPSMDLAGTVAVVEYWRWYHISTEWDDSLLVEVSNDNGSNWVEVESVDDRQIWTHAEWTVNDFVTPTGQVRVRFTVNDNPNNSLIESLIDDFIVSTLTCSSNPPEAIDDLAAHMLEGDIVLQWTEPASEGGVDRYVVYRSTDVAIPGDSLAGTASPSYTDPGAAGDTGTNYYYTVKAVGSGGLKSEASNKTGEFDVDLINAPPE